MHGIASAVVRWRFVIMLLFLLAAVYCALSVGKVQVSSDLTMFLSPETETRRGLIIMEDEFITCASENIMVSNITCEGAEALAAGIKGLAGVDTLIDPCGTVSYKPISPRRKRTVIRIRRGHMHILGFSLPGRSGEKVNCPAGAREAGLGRRPLRC